MGAPIVVTLAEGGKAIVHDGDPAYDHCRLLSKAGYKSIFIPFATLRTGRSLLRDVTVIEPRSLDTAAALDQVLAMEEEPECKAHHYVIEYAEVGMLGTCKYCGTAKVFPKNPKLSGRPASPREMKAMDDDLRERLFSSTHPAWERGARSNAAA